MNFTGRAALVTGAGRGLGLAIAEALADAGAAVAVADLREESAFESAEMLSRRGARALPLCFDVGDEKQGADALQRIERGFGRLDFLINNAGADFTLPIEELSFDDWDKVIRTNLRGPFVLSKLAFPLLETNAGAVVNIASTAAKRCWANAAAYHASKWGLLGLSHALHVEGRARGIKVSAVIAGCTPKPTRSERRLRHS